MSNDEWISVKSVGAWIMGIVSATTVLMIGAFCTWLASNVIDISKRIELNTNQIAYVITQAHADVTRIDADLLKIKDMTDNNNMRIAKLEFYKDAVKK